MSTQTEPTTHTIAGDYRVVHQRSGLGIDRYLRVIGPEGRASEQKVLATYSMTRYQVAEEAVAGHLGPDAVMSMSTTAREAQEGGFIVTVD